jgi:hypothetical protein
MEEPADRDVKDPQAVTIRPSRRFEKNAEKIKKRRTLEIFISF